MPYMSERYERGRQYTPEELLKHLASVPMAEVLVDGFLTYAQGEKRKVVYGPRDYLGPKLLGAVSGAEDQLSIILDPLYANSGVLDMVTFDLYGLPFDWFSGHWDNAYGTSIVASATAQRLPDPKGWISEQLGTEMVNGISVHFYQPLALPSRKSRKALEIMTSLAQQASEHHNPLVEQPRFWDKPD